MFGTLDARVHAKAMGIVVGRAYWDYHKKSNRRVVTRLSLDAGAMIVHYTGAMGRGRNCTVQEFVTWFKGVPRGKKRAPIHTHVEYALGEESVLGHDTGMITSKSAGGG